MPTLTTISIRFDEQQLLDLAAKARVQGNKRGYLHKADPKLRKLTLRWCCVYQNFLFYFESESCTKPLGVVFLECCTCRPVDQIGVPARDVDVSLCCRLYVVPDELIIAALKCAVQITTCVLNYRPQWCMCGIRMLDLPPRRCLPSHNSLLL